MYTEKYFIQTAGGKVEEEGRPYKFYKSGEHWHAIPIDPNKTVWTAYRQTGPEFIAYLRKEGSRVKITEKMTGYRINSRFQNNKTIKEAIKAVEENAENIYNRLVERAQK